TAIIVDDGLTEVEALIERRTGNSRDSRVDRLHFGIRFGSWCFEFVVKLRFERADNSRSFRNFQRFSFRFAEQPRALAPCPRTQPEKPAVYESHCHQTLQSRINPTVQRNIGRTEALRGRFGMSPSPVFAPTGPRIAAQFRIVVSRVGLVAGKLTYQCS